MARKHIRIIVGLALALPLVTIWACGRGAAEVEGGEILRIIASHLGMAGADGNDMQHDAIIWIIRLPRVLLSLFVGASLALCGVAMQGLFRNPLADPSIIGVSSGAGLAAAVVIVLLGDIMVNIESVMGLPLLPLASFGGAWIATILIFSLAREKRRTNVATMLLAGIAINALAGAGTGLLTYIADDAQLRSLTFWTLGSLGGATWNQAGIMGLATLATVLLLFPMGKAFNALSLGEVEAGFLGIPVEKLKNRIIIATGIAIGTSVAFCGIIGFVGLVVPHLMRLAGGAQHRYLLPASTLCGALLLCGADTLSRTIVAPAELPIGIVTSLVGGPVFLFLLFRSKKEMANATS